jgi:non-ribosomal peptide synthetase-like protein
VYPLFGVAHSIQRLVAVTSNITPLTALFGDSSAIVGYLRLLGYRFGVIEQTGSNFGMVVKHGVPSMCEVGTGTMVADGLTMMNAEFSSGAFRLMPVKVGRRNYLGNLISYPAESRAGDNCLLATKVLVPVAGPERHDVGLLGSPSFEIPRSAEPDEYRHLHEEPERSRRLAAKTRHNVITMGLHLLVWLIFLTAVLATGILPVGGSGIADLPGTVASELLDGLIFPVAFFVLVERAATGFRHLEPRRCSIYERPFWRHERYWKVASIAFMRLFDGTPFKPLVWRAMGVRMGRRVFDDGCRLVERTMVQIGDDCTLGLGSTLHCHSMEDAVFKLDRITIGDRCTIGSGALVHYDVTLGDDAVLETDSFVMKGSRVPRGARWRGNPAAEATPRPS